MQPLEQAFFARSALDVAPELIGKLLVHEWKGERLAGRIVETEAYTQDDPAFHGWGIVDRETGLIRPEGRGLELFGPPGRAYIYLNYGLYWLLNVITEPEGFGGCVLIRAVEPIEGISIMRQNRPGARRDRDLTSGPGKLTQAFEINRALHTHPLTEPPLYLAAPDDEVPLRIETSSRIGITRAVELQWRFFVPGNPYVSPGTPSDRIPPEKRGRKLGRGPGGWGRRPDER